MPTEPRIRGRYRRRVLASDGRGRMDVWGERVCLRLGAEFVHDWALPSPGRVGRDERGD